MKLLRFFFFLLIFIAPASSLTAQSAALKAASPETAPTAGQTLDQGEVQKLIDILEDEQRRAEMVRLLKVLAAMETKDGKIPAEVLSTEPEAVFDLLGSLKKAASNTYNQMEKFQSNATLSLERFHESIGDVLELEMVDIWQPFVIKICIWALICNLASWFLTRRYGHSFAVVKDVPLGRLWAVCKYILVSSGPSLLLIVSLIMLPPLALSTASGASWLFEKNLNFIQSLFQFFFICVSGIHVIHRLAKVLFRPGEPEQAIIAINPLLLRQLYNGLRIFVIYLAIVVFLRWTFIAHFAMSSLPEALTTFLIIPIPIFLTVRIIKLKRTIRQLRLEKKNLEEASDADQKDKGPEQHSSQEPPESSLDYPFDRLAKDHWSSILLFYIWVVSLVAIFRHAKTQHNFWECFFGSLGIILLTAVILKVQRFLVLNIFSSQTDHGRHTIAAIDNVCQIIFWLLSLAFILDLWGMPISEIWEKPIFQEIAARFLAIILILFGTLLVLRFSRFIANWILSSPEFSQNRMWRTMTPLLQTAVKALAIFVAVVVILERLGVNIGPILAGAGILGLGVGMGAQSLIKDLINGVSILLMDTLVVGDWVKIGATEGTVEAVGLRTLRLRDSSGSLAIIPNSVIDVIVNMTKDYSREIIDLLIPYDAEPDPVIALAREVGKTMDEDEFWNPLLISPVEVVGVLAISEKGTTIRIRLHTVPGVQWAAGREMKLRLKRALLKFGLKAPYQPMVVENLTCQVNVGVPNEAQKQESDKLTEGSK